MKKRFFWYLLCAAWLSLFAESKALSHPFPQTELHTNNIEEKGQDISVTTIRDQAIGHLSGKGVTLAQEWFHGKGTIQTNLQSSHSLTYKNASVDTLWPLFFTDKNGFFTQLGLRDNEGRFTTNVGLGHRHFMQNWLVGYNLFWDTDWRNNNQRMGVGLEAWRDSLNISVNGYHRLSGWKHSNQHQDYQERPANGIDVRAEGWLAAYPSFGGKVIFEKYWGNQVALIDFNHRQKNPYAITTGLMYTPIPIITTGVDWKSSKSGVNDTRLTLSMNYRLGIPWDKQLSPDETATLHSLTNDKFALVNRNNNVTLDFKRSEQFILRFPNEIRGRELSFFTFKPDIVSTHSVTRLELDDAALVAAGGKVITASPEEVILQLPLQRERSAILLKGVAVNGRGVRSNIARTVIWPISANHVLTLTADKTSAAADGHDMASLKVHVADALGNALPDEPVTLTTDGGALVTSSGKTDSDGNLFATLTSTIAGEFHVTAIDGEWQVTHPGITFNGNYQAAFSIDKTEIIADGKDVATVRLTLTDKAGAPVADQKISWQTTLGTLSAFSSVTQKDGSAFVELHGQEVGDAVVSASVDSDVFTAPKIRLTELSLLANVHADRTQVVANGYEGVTYTIAVNQVDGTPLAGEAVTWSTDLGSLSATTSVTNQNGEASVMLSSNIEGDAHVTALTHGKTYWAPVVAFTEHLVTWLMTPPNANADGVDEATLTIQVYNTNYEPMENEVVHWETNLGQLSATSTVTDALGISVVTLTSKEPGQARVRTTVRGNTQSGTINFIRK